MSIETEFESTITNVQNAYQGLDNLGATIPQNKTIENIKSCLDEIYNKFPKTSYAEGSNITLSNTLKGKLDFEDGIVGYGQTEQYTTTGINLLDISAFATEWVKNGVTFTPVPNGGIKIKGTASANTYLDIAYSKSFNGNYTMITKMIGTYTNQSPQVVLQDSSSQNIMFNNNFTNNSIKINSFNNVNQSMVRTRMVAVSGGVYDCILYPMCVSGTYTVETAPNFEPYTGEQASPNPSYPQDIEVVRGKNLFDKDNANIINSYFLQTDTTISASGNTYRSIYIECKPNTIYTISKVLSARFCIGYTTTTPTVGVSVLGVIQNNTATSITITTGSNAKYLIAFIYHSSYDTLTPQQIYDTVQIEKGSQATSYLPYNTLEVVERGKNLAKEVKIAEVTTAYNGVLYIDIENDLQLNTTYTLSFIGKNGYKVYLNENITTVQYVTCNGNKQSLTFTTSGNIDKTNSGQYSTSVGGWVIFKNQTGNTETATFTEVMLETSSTATTYEPYQTPQTYQLSLGEYEFAKIGNYVDTIEYDVDEDKVYKNEKIGKTNLYNVNIASLQNINSYGIANFLLRPIEENAQGTTANDDCLCNRFSKQDTTIANTQTEGFLPALDPSIHQAGVFIRIDSSKADTIDKMKTWFQNNPTYYYWARYTPILKEITGTLKDQIKALYNSQSFTGTTIIEIDGQLPLIIKVRALKGE